MQDTDGKGEGVQFLSNCSSPGFAEPDLGSLGLSAAKKDPSSEVLPDDEQPEVDFHCSTCFPGSENFFSQGRMTEYFGLYLLLASILSFPCH